LLTEFAILPGLDNRKMSKSYGNCIYLSDSEETLRKKVGSMFTDPEKIRKNDPGHPDQCPVQAYHAAYDAEGAAEAAPACEAGTLGCVAHKRQVADQSKAGGRHPRRGGAAGKGENRRDHGNGLAGDETQVRDVGGQWGGNEAFLA